jgi:hypothetical protein
MQHAEIAQKLGLSLMDVEQLVQGKATAKVAERFGVSMADISDFTQGKATFAMTQRLGFQSGHAAEELAKVAGGAGVLIGYILNM